jgi:TolB-like protein
MDEGARYRELVETDEYFFQLDYLAQRYSDAVLDAALMAVLWGIATNPDQYDKVTGRIYVAKSRSFRPLCPRLRLFFQLIDDHRVLMLWIEEIDEEAEEIADGDALS